MAPRPGAGPGPAAVRDSFVVGAVASMAALLTAFAASAVIAAMVANATRGASGAVFPVARVAAWLFGMGFGAPLTFVAGGSASSYGSGSVGVNIHLPVPLIMLVAAAVTAALTVRSQRARPVLEPAGALVAAGCAAVVPAVVGLVAALASATSSGAFGTGIFAGNARLGLSTLPATAYPALVVFGVSAFARFGAGGVRVPAGLVQTGIGPALRAVGDYLLLTAALASIVGLAVALVDISSVGAVLGAWLLTLPGVGLLTAQLAAFAPLEMSGASGGSLSGVGSLLSSAGLSGGSGSAAASKSVSLYGGQAPAWTWLLLVIPVVGIVVAGTRYTLRRPASPTPPVGAAVLTGLVLAAVLFVFDLYLRFGGSAAGQASTSTIGGASGSGAGGIGIGALGYLSALVVGALVPLAGWVLTPMLYRGAPGLLRATASLPFRSRPVLAVLPPRGGNHPEAAPAGPGRSSGALVLALVLLLAAAGGGVAAGQALAGPATDSQTSADVGVPQPTYVPPTETAPSFPADPATEAPSSTPDPTTASAPTMSAGGIDLSAVAEDPVVTDVAGTFDNYFGAINRHDGAAALSNFDPSGALNPNDSSQVAQFQRETSTSTDDQVVIHYIQPDSGTAGGYLVSVSFRSRQAPSFGPGGNQACTLWNLSYHMTAQFKLLRSSGAQHTAC